MALEESKHRSAGLPAHSANAECLVFARVIPFEWSTPSSADCSGNILTAQGRGQAVYTHYEKTGTPALFVAVPVGMLICGSSRKTAEALKAGLRRHILELVEDRPGEERAGGETPRELPPTLR